MKSGPNHTLPPFHERVKHSLQQAGYSENAVGALVALDLDNFHYVRRVIKGEIPQVLIEELGAGLETTQFHALSAIQRIGCGQGRAKPQEPTVGLLAEEMAVDPSRASRIAADLVDRGYLARAVSQTDGRRSVLELTAPATELLEAFRAAKWRHTAQLFKSWPEQDIVDFTRLFKSYVDGMRQEYPARERP